jgi:uncharacterized protein
MSDLPRYLKQLDKLLMNLPSDAMLLSELDGYLTGIVVCPELVMPSEWLPGVWAAEDDEPVFENSKQAEKLMQLVMEHYNTIARSLNGSSGEFAPLFEVDTRHNETLWELWIDGFDQAMRLRPEAWARLLVGDDETRAALVGLVSLAEISRTESKLSEEDADELTRSAHDLIPDWVETLNAARLAEHMADTGPQQAPAFGKVGRNDPCPCGSGRKYKKCCGLN